MQQVCQRVGPYRVGIIGAGPGVSALHIPVLERLGEIFEVVHVADAGSGRAVDLAAPLGARASSGITELLADPDVDVVAICSPPAEHAEQVLAAVAAGKRAIFCEKPLALTKREAEVVVAACRDANVALTVGTNHLYDPAWLRAKHHHVARADRVRTISVTLSLPPNGRYHEQVTRMPSQGAGTHPSRGAPDWGNPEVAAGIVQQLVIGLGVHDLPLLRDLAPTIDGVIYANPLPPLGYSVGYRSGDVLVRMTALMLPGGADALWRFSIGTDRDQIDISFPPAFVHAGSAAVEVREEDGRTVSYARVPENGYLAEWKALAELLEPGKSVEYGELLADAEYAIQLADGAAAVVRNAASGRTTEVPL